MELVHREEVQLVSEAITGAHQQYGEVLLQLDRGSSLGRGAVALQQDESRESGGISTGNGGSVGEVSPTAPRHDDRGEQASHQRRATAEKHLVVEVSKPAYPWNLKDSLRQQGPLRSVVLALTPNYENCFRVPRECVNDTEYHRPVLPLEVHPAGTWS